MTNDLSENAGMECRCQVEKVIFLTCSGASNCGQIANQVAVKLDGEGMGRMYCLVGIGAHNEGMIESAKSVDRIAIIDGCAIACGRKTAEHAGLVVTDWVCVTDAGIAKVHQFAISPDEIELVSRRTRKVLTRRL